MVKCKCGKKAVYVWNTESLCAEHFQKKFRHETKKVLSEFIEPADRLAIAVSGGKDSTALLQITKQFTDQQGIRLDAILIDEGIKGYRDISRQFIEQFCVDNKIKFHIVSFEQDFGSNLDSYVLTKNKKKLELNACAICGTFRRYLINKKARELGATKVLFAHNLDDEVQTLFMNLFSGNLGQLTRKGILTGALKNKGFVVRFKPFLHIPEKAVALYSQLEFPELPDTECPYLHESLRDSIRRFVFQLENEQPGSKKRIMDAYLNVLPKLKKKVTKVHTKLQDCELCSEPTSQAMCKVCEIRKKLGDKLRA
ncbi:MAG: TIGR00269 family protein [Candidatus Altiarchaeota archaeon]|nr:TIGR00269 family protein [Candidatus Altiarchaeota archaeon]